MASVPNSPWFCTLKPTKTPPSSIYTNPRNCTFKSLKVSSSSPNSSNSSDKSLEPEEAELDPVKLAFAKAKAYKKSTKSNPTPQINQNPVAESAETVKKIDGSGSEVAGGDSKEVSVAFKVAMERAKEDEKNRGGLNSSKRMEGSEAISSIFFLRK